MWFWWRADATVGYSREFEPHTDGNAGETKETIL